MNDDQQAPEGVEITHYVGETGSPHPARRSASGDNKASDALASLPARQGSPAITRWAVAGLLCTIAALLLFFSTLMWGYFYTMGITYATSPIIYRLVSYLPFGLEVIGVVIGIVVLVLRRRASKPGLVAILSTISLSITGTLIFFVAMVILALGNMHI